MGDIVLTETYCATGHTACESSYPEGHPQRHATHRLEAQKVHFRRKEGPIVCYRATHEDTHNTMLPTYNQKSHRGCQRAMKINDEGYLNRTDQPLFQKTYPKQRSVYSSKRYKKKIRYFSTNHSSILYLHV